ncbi:MAG TPA: S8 family serine peptidase [Chitinispirillaceae bacterium]|nr:S8 family serine peptidase [Chitinispirillaceae bacterium]
MKATVKTYLNVRAGKPSVNAPNYSYYKPGDQIEYIDIVEGDLYENSNLWLKGDDGNYYWSGGVEKIPDDAKVNWGINSLNVDKLWNYTQGEDIRVAVLDTGIDLHNTDLKEAIVEKWNFIDGNENVNDSSGHGTNCAGVIAARGKKNVIGVAPKANLVIAKIGNDSNNDLQPEIIMNAIEWAIKKNAIIISMSFGLVEPVPQIQNPYPEIKSILEKYFKLKKGIFISAIGNAGQLKKKVHVYPATFEECVAVGAINKTNKRLVTSNFSEFLDLLAPGADILSTDLNNNTKLCSASSIATAFVSGVFALLTGYIAKKKINVNYQELIEIVYDSADNYGVTGKDIISGYGIINPNGALMKIKARE